MTKKVIARLFGGLGNQLFIYATARALAERHQATLLLDINSGFVSDLYERQFALNHFNIQYQEAPRYWAFHMFLGKEVRYFSRNLNRIIPYPFKFHLSDFWDDPKKYIPAINSNSMPPAVWMEGYWQAPEYFDSIRRILKHEIQVTTPVSQQTHNLCTSIQKNNSVGMHLRMLRNYIKGVEIINQHKMNTQHYLKCMDYMATKLVNPHFYCFSDNPDIMESIVRTSHNVTFVTHNKGGHLAHEDFYLMSHCRHFILSNSTFGWWPAWLSDFPNSIVLSPPLNYWDNRNILPKNWLTSDKLTRI